MLMQKPNFHVFQIIVEIFQDFESIEAIIIIFLIVNNI